MTAHGIDPGNSSAVAAVTLDQRTPRCVGLVQVYGVNWIKRMDAALAAAHGPVFCEVMQPKIRASAHARNHAVAFSLGRKVGVVEALCFRYGLSFHPLTTAQWWAALPTALGPKRANPSHRVEECCDMVRDAAAWLDTVPTGRKPDCAEAILIAAAGALHG